MSNQTMDSVLELDRVHWETLLRAVSDWLPNSLVVYHWLKISCTGMAPNLDGSSCYVNSWPGPTSICCIDPVMYDGLSPSCFLSFAIKNDDEIEFANFLRSIDSILGLSRGYVRAICGLSLPSQLANIYCSYFRKGNFLVKFYENEAYWVPPEFHNILIRSRVDPPMGYYLDTLRLEESELVDETWPHRWRGSLPLNIRKIRYMPNSCLRKWETDELASLEIMHSEFGLINHLYTFPKFRRQGLAKCVEIRQMQKVVSANMMPYKLVVCNNEAPVKLTEKIGFWQKYGQYPFVEIFNGNNGKVTDSNRSSTSEESND